jgi:hypothetical protein
MQPSFVQSLVEEVKVGLEPDPQLTPRPQLEKPKKKKKKMGFKMADMAKKKKADAKKK